MNQRVTTSNFKFFCTERGYDMHIVLFFISHHCSSIILVSLFYDGVPFLKRYACDEVMVYSRSVMLSQDCHGISFERRSPALTITCTKISLLFHVLLYM